MMKMEGQNGKGYKVLIVTMFRTIIKSHQTHNAPPATQRISRIDVVRNIRVAVLIIVVVSILILMVIMYVLSLSLHVTVLLVAVVW